MKPLASTAVRRQVGVSLIEALVALAVIAFGLLGAVGAQFALRQNGDLVRQQAEAMRIAQENIEVWRAYDVVAAPAVPASGVTAYAGIGNQPEETVAGTASNTNYLLTRTVTDAQTGAPREPRIKTLVVDVRWKDRADRDQTVRLTTRIAGVPPELAGSLGLPARSSQVGPVRGRHPAVPVQANDIEGGRSVFPPPGGGTLTWTFDNYSGLIVRVCASPDACEDVTLLPVSGFVRFATGAVQPSATDAESPPGSRVALDVVIAQSAPSAADVSCFEEFVDPEAIAYYCAVPTAGSVPTQWSGRARLAGTTFAPLVAASLAVVDSAAYKVCRYTPENTDTPTRGNIDQPLDYLNVREPLAQQNFLVIRAGNGTVPFSCPVDDAATPVNSNTRAHQPNS